MEAPPFSVVGGMDEIGRFFVAVMLGIAALYLVWTHGYATMDPMPFWYGVLAVGAGYAAWRVYEK